MVKEVLSPWSILYQLSEMPNFYLYSSSYEKKNRHDELVSCSVTVLFCDRDHIELGNLQGEIKQFYTSNYQTDEIFVIGGEYHLTQLTNIFVGRQSETFKDIPKLEIDHLSENLYLMVFDKDGRLRCANKDCKIDSHVLDSIINDGLINIFQVRGGLIEANGNAHHFVFPSGKHCNKFLRTGNILLHSSEIYFIAFNLLSKLKEGVHDQIFCDTSSINTLAFALLELKRKSVGSNFKVIPIESFSSYDGLFSKSIKYFGNSLILVSSSTSGNIIQKIIEHDDKVDINNIIILYFLGEYEYYVRNRNNFICNLTKSRLNPNGIDFYDTFSERDCIYCKKGSYPVEVKGDVFLLERPKINRITIKVGDAPKRLSSFVDQFKATARTTNNVLKVNYKESLYVENKYEIYFDMFHVLSAIEDPDSKLYRDYKVRLLDFINQYIPINAKYIIYLPDEGSEKLADIILHQIKDNYRDDRLPVKVPFDEVLKILSDKEMQGAAVIVGSCISNGKNLLYLSRALRPFEKLKLIYFIGLVRTSNQGYSDFLKSNLSQGSYGKNTHSLIEVETFYCNKDSRDTSWIREKDFLRELLEDIEDKGEEDEEVYLIFLKRIQLIDDSLNKSVKGLANSLFYPNTSNKELRLRKGFVFFNFRTYVDHVSQADVYFTISAVINNLRNSDSFSQCLSQTEFVRNILDPGNFNRYNDGLIQACILRSAKSSELSYHIDENLSADMFAILEKIIDEHSSPQGEGLLEFLYALAIEKLTLKRDHLASLINKISEKVDNPVASALAIYIKDHLLGNKVSLLEQVKQLKEDNKRLKLEISSLSKEVNI